MVFTPGVAGLKMTALLIPVGAGAGCAFYGVVVYKDTIFAGSKVSDAFLLVQTTTDISDQTSEPLYYEKDGSTAVGVVGGQSGGGLGIASISSWLPIMASHTHPAVAGLSEPAAVSVPPEPIESQEADSRSTVSDNNKFRNYYCEFKDAQINNRETVSNACRVFEVSMDSDNRWMRLSNALLVRDEQLVKHSEDATTVKQSEKMAQANKTSLAKKHNYFLIQLTEQTLASLKFQDTAGIDIDIKPIAGGDGKKFATVKMVFAEWQKKLFWKSKYALAKAETLQQVPAIPPVASDTPAPPIKTITIDQTTTPNSYKCSFLPDITTTDNLQTCTVYNFSDAAPTPTRVFYDSNWTGTKTQSTLINTDWWYLIEFDKDMGGDAYSGQHLELMGVATPPTSTIKFKHIIPVASVLEDSKMVPFVLIF